jgi:tRNA modification GTPase
LNALCETSETFVACLTPPGAAAIATLAMRGPRALAVVRELCRPGSEPQRGDIILSSVGQDLADKVVVTLKRDGLVPWVEIHCHGGPQVIHLLTDALQSYGVRPCTWQELERMSRAGVIQAAAGAALAEALTARTAAILLDQYRGAFGRAVEAIQAALARDDGTNAGRMLAEIARYTEVGRHLTVPWRMVVAGAPNVGKSSLVNALAGFPRCVVATSPGTTRDVVTALIAVEGWPVELADTAGLREAAGELEEQGIGRARQAAATADLCLWLLDASTAPIYPSRGAVTQPAGGPRDMLWAVNKIDLPWSWDLQQAAGSVHISARTGAGLTELCQAAGRALVPSAPPPGAPVPFTPYLCDQVEEAHRHCLSGRVEDARRLITSLANSST